MEMVATFFLGGRKGAFRSISPEAQAAPETPNIRPVRIATASATNHSNPCRHFPEAAPKEGKSVKFGDKTGHNGCLSLSQKLLFLGTETGSKVSRGGVSYARSAGTLYGRQFELWPIPNILPVRALGCWWFVTEGRVRPDAVVVTPSLLWSRAKARNRARVTLFNKRGQRKF